MTIELTMTAANLLALIAVLVKQEARMTKVETLVALLANGKNLE